MQEQFTLYEQPLNERLRFFLRLESLFRQARHSLSGPSPLDSHTALTALLDIMGVTTRIDIKTEVLKELERVGLLLGSLSATPQVDHGTLAQILSTVQGLRTQLYGTTGSVAQELRDNELLKILLQKSGVPGGLSDFELPPYRHWLCQPATQRIADLKQWVGTLDNLRLSIEVLLKMVRESTEPVAREAQAGMYQQTLDSSIPYQLIRVTLPQGHPCYAEVSAGKHRFTVRFMERPQYHLRATQTTQDVPFQLACCVL